MDSNPDSNLDPTLIQVEALEKHQYYALKYIPNDIYWGIGIENEVYFEMSNSLDIDVKTFYTKNAKRERYSVNYFTSYRPGVYESCIEKIDLAAKVPVLINAHSFTKTDINNQHMTTYTKNPQPNPKFNGKTIYEFICDKDSYFSDEYMKSYIFDGDTIEFISQNFYKTTINSVINELINTKKEFITKLQKVFNDNNVFSNYGTIDFCYKNHPFISCMTNINNCSIFNNMTYHFNFTLPTKLNDLGLIEDYTIFTEQHKNAINLIQWIEPFLIALYGSGDIFSSVNPNLTTTSQRCAKSRYIGFGTYDTDKMVPGKVVQIESENNHLSNLDYWWFNRYYQISDYTKEPNIGVDINFHKHKNHGIEIRIFDYFEESKLEEVLKFIVLILDLSLDKKIESPVRNVHWNNFVYNILLDRNTKIDNEIKEIYEEIFDFKTSFETISEFFNKINLKLIKKYEGSGICYKNMINSN